MRKVIKILLWCALGLAIVGGVILFVYMYKQVTSELNDERTVKEAALKTSSRMCSVYSVREARATLGSEVATSSVAYPSGLISAVEDSNLKPQVDGCSYVGDKNNSRYVYMTSQLYSSTDDAEKDFNLQKQRILDAQDRNPNGYGDEMFYYGGGFFIRKENVLLSISANKPEVQSSDQEVFTKEILDMIYKDAIVIF